ncbi:MAG: Inner membrane protein CreD [Stenotrophomonas maltophilia]|nr:MAG: Inner membrane protein CreD [Stenotrophomonas maltophilia]
MNRTLAIKLGAIALLILLLLIPLLMIGGLVGDRQANRNDVVQDIARSSAYEQRVTGPLVVVPYERTEREWQREKDKARVLVTSTVKGTLYFLPDSFLLDGQMTTELRHRGIYEARLYHMNGRISGRFVLPANYGITDKVDDYRFGQPYLAVGLSDVRGIENALKLSFNGKLTDFSPGSQVQVLGEGVHADLPLAMGSGVAEQRFDYAFELGLLGSSRLAVTPMGRDSQVALASDWPHPSFGGEFLPVERKVSDSGFEAHWRSSFFATNLEDVVHSCIRQGDCNAEAWPAFGVSLVDPVDQYLKSDRALKYALLFIGLTFAGFFLFEVLKGLSVHPMQYALVGLALALFYLLLLSLSEHLGFELAYGISASACVGLIGIYLSAVLRGSLRALGFSAGLAALYAMLYGLLRAEDYALLMGSVLLFVLLAGVMLLTRRVDWSRIGQGTPPPSFSMDDVEVQGE